MRTSWTYGWTSWTHGLVAEETLPKEATGNRITHHPNNQQNKTKQGIFSSATMASRLLPPNTTSTSNATHGRTILAGNRRQYGLWMIKNLPTLPQLSTGRSAQKQQMLSLLLDSEAIHRCTPAIPPCRLSRPCAIFHLIQSHSSTPATQYLVQSGRTSNLVGSSMSPVQPPPNLDSPRSKTGGQPL
jgi:hypothetical protein